MKANKFSGTGGLQHWLCASATVAEPCPSSLPWSGGTLPPENPTLGFRNLPLFCTKISQGQKIPSPFSPRILPCLRLHLDETRAGRAGKGGNSAGLALALPCPLLTVTCTGCSYSAELCILSFTLQTP